MLDDLRYLAVGILYLATGYCNSNIECQALTLKYVPYNSSAQHLATTINYITKLMWRAEKGLEKKKQSLIAEELHISYFSRRDCILKNPRC